MLLIYVYFPKPWASFRSSINIIQQRGNIVNFSTTLYRHDTVLAIQDLFSDTLSLNTKSLRKFALTWDQWQIGLWTSAKQTSMSVKSEKSSPVRKMLLKYWNCYRKNIWQLKNIWRTLEDVKSNSGQLLFSSPNWYFHSYWS